jgi:hypothetical protein
LFATQDGTYTSSKLIEYIDHPESADEDGMNRDLTVIFDRNKGSDLFLLDKKIITFTTIFLKMPN